MIHLASLCHDDVIDNAVLRRHQEALWVASSASAAVLMGDLLLCDAMELVRQVRSGRHVEDFLAKAPEEVVQKEKERLQSWTEKLAKLKAHQDRIKELMR